MNFLFVPFNRIKYERNSLRKNNRELKFFEKKVLLKPNCSKLNRKFFLFNIERYFLFKLKLYSPFNLKHIEFITFNLINTRISQKLK